MAETLLDLPAFDVVGMRVRTSNAGEMSGAGGRIGPLWRAFMNGAAEGIVNVAEPDVIYSLYTGYENDETGAYDVVLGKSVTSAAVLPEGMTHIAIPAASYLVFPAEDNSPQAIQAAWAGVYRYFSGRYFSGTSAFRRAFTVDFDKHSAVGVELYIAVKDV